MGMNKRVWCVLLAVALLLSSGCSVLLEPNDNGDPAPESTTQTTEITTVPDDTTTQTTTAEPTVTTTESTTTTAKKTTTTKKKTTTTKKTTATEYSTAASVALNSFRQSMVDTPELFAVAYFGYADRPVDDPTAWLRFACFGLCEDLPFLTEIPDKRVVGNKMGEVFCIVPLNEETTIKVYGAVEKENGECTYETKLYSSKKGEPILLFCNGSGFDPDTKVVVTTSAGNSVTWYPRIGDTVKIEKENGTCGDNNIKDFSSYSELLWNEYTDRKDDGWKLPTAKQLVGTTWSCKEYKLTGSVYSYEVTFRKGVADVRWNNDGEDHEYSNATWEITYDEGVALITFDFGGLAGPQTCAILLSDDQSLMYTCANVVAGEDVLCVTDVSYRVLRQSVG